METPTWLIRNPNNKRFHRLTVFYTVTPKPRLKAGLFIEYRCDRQLVLLLRGESLILEGGGTLSKKTKKQTRRWVVKVGSQMVSAGGPLLIRAWMEQVVALKRDYQIEVIWVSSGAISSAVTRTHFTKKKSDWLLNEKQALSAIGQPILMDLYNLACHATGLLASQVLLTASDLADKTRRTNFQNSIEQLLKWEVLPILNENDAIATEEIKFGDNDSLSAKVACVTQAHRLVILTDVDGLYEKDPRLHPEARLVDRIKKVTPKHLALAGAHSGSKHGTGGMFSKIRAAQEAARGGVETLLVRGDAPGVLLRAAEDSCVGTFIEKKS